jgi:hypothetical protein
LLPLFQKRMLHIEKSLSKSVNISTKLELIQMSREPIYINENRYIFIWNRRRDEWKYIWFMIVNFFSYCVTCKKTFTNCQFARYPNGVIVHIECVKDPKICPLTGQLFTIDVDKHHTKPTWLNKYIQTNH